jgi:ATP-dependent helicase HepA
MFVAGQRWLSHADTELGLGIVTAVDARYVTISFPAADTERTYAADNAPLSRIVYRVGDRVQLRDERELTIDAVNELRGLLIYIGTDAQGREHTVTEQMLSARVQLTGPLQRLGSGRCANNAAFALRLETLQHRHRLQQSAAAGLLGARTSLLPHQLYIADRVARRHAPRVLLADEVGLGKTIEAGLIMHQQLHSGRAERVLVLAPDSLQHQWLVEMLRRFNLRFALFDAERLAALGAQPEAADNPFDSAQLVLCSIDWLANDDAAALLARAAHWDLLVVDEAHHLHWSEQHSSAEYRCVEQLAARSAGLILLTATPEQAGIDSHFARLRLLDPARFHDLERFKREAAGYQPLNQLVQALLQQPGKLPPALLPQLREYLPQAGADSDSADIIRQLLDRHGTGRVLFRNTRAAVAGFPQRRVHPQPLPQPARYRPHGDQLYPESAFSTAQWLQEDTRVAWLEQLLKQLRPAKVLVICARADTAVALEQYLHLRAGIRSAAFHEGLTLLERDRAAAWFAETDQGAQALVCSEIGSEGRNFQFAQHLVLFDLPLNPDLLEQRIGRLDRIGQGAHIDIHVPYLQGGAQEVLFRWLHEGLDLFRSSFAAGYALYEQFRADLQQQLRGADAQLETLIAATAQATQATRAALQQGRDALLELNSCDAQAAQQLIARIDAEQHSEELQGYLERVWNYFGVDSETHSEHALVLRPSEHLLAPFPELPDDGVTVTCSRSQALSREDMEYLTWEHPMVLGAMDLIVSAEHGNAGAATINIKGLQPGTLLLEAVYAVSCPAPRALQLERFLPLAPQRVLVDQGGKNLSAVLAHDRLNGLCSNLPRHAAPALLAQVREPLVAMQEHTARYAAAALPALIAQAETALAQHLGDEIARLKALRAVNPAIRAEEIEFFERQLAAGRAIVQQASLQLQALRIVIAT